MKAQAGLELVAGWLHAVHGTKGLTIAAMGLMVWLVVEPALGASEGYLWVMLPLTTLFLAGLATLPREGVAVQARGRAILHNARPAQVLGRRTVWLAFLVILLLPRVFMAVYGIPHLSPFTGLIRPSIVHRLSTAYLAAVLLLCATYVRSSRHEARHIMPRRPIELKDASGSHIARQGLQIALALLVAAWLWLLQPFWGPFSLFSSDPDLSSLRSARDVTSLVFAIVPPALLMTGITGHLEALWQLRTEGRFKEERGLAITLGICVMLALVAVWLHARDLLWIARFQEAGVL